MTEAIPVEGYIPAIGKVTLFSESSQSQKKAVFRAIVLDWDKENKEWSMETSNGVRYHKESTIKAFEQAINDNGSLPVMYNHITDGPEADQLGVINKVIDTEEGMIIEGYLNMTKQRVKEEIIPGYLKNVSLQVIADDYYEDDKTGTIYAKPTRALEVSFVPVNGREGAKLLDVAIKESLNGGISSKNPTFSNETTMEMARKAVAFEEIINDLQESDISMAFRMVEGNLSQIDAYIDELEKKGVSEKRIIQIVSKKFGIEEDELEDMMKEGLMEDVTTGNSSAATTTKLSGQDKKKDKTPTVQQMAKDMKEGANAQKAKPYAGEIEKLVNRITKPGMRPLPVEKASTVSKEIAKRHTDISAADVTAFLVNKYGVAATGKESMDKLLEEIRETQNELYAKIEAYIESADEPDINEILESQSQSQSQYESKAENLSKDQEEKIHELVRKKIAQGKFEGSSYRDWFKWIKSLNFGHRPTKEETDEVLYYGLYLRQK